VRRHDGRLLDARDVAAQLGRAFASGRALAAAGLDVTSVAAPDPGTLVLRTAAPAGWLPNYLAYVLLRFDRGEPGLPPAGTGPYVYGGEAPDGAVVLDAFPGTATAGRPSTGWSSG